MILPARHVKMRQLRFTKGKGDVAALRNFHGVVKRLRQLGEKQTHLFFALEIKLLGFKFEARLLPDCVIRLDADEHLLDAGILFINIMRIISNNKRNPRFPGKANDEWIDLLLLTQAMILQL